MARAKSSASNGLQIVHPFADADEMDGQAEALGQRDQNAALRRAVELGHDQAGERRSP